MLAVIATSKKWHQGHKYALMVLNANENTSIYVFVANATKKRKITECFETEQAILVGDVWIEIPDTLNGKSTYLCAGTNKPLTAIKAALEWQKARGYLHTDSLTIHTTAYGTWIGKNRKVIDIISQEVGQQVKVEAK